MNKEYTPEQRRDLAKRLRGVTRLLYSLDFDELPTDEFDDMMDAIEDAIDYISPEFVRDEASELEAALNSPEMDAFMEEMKKDPGYQQGLEEFQQLTQKVVPFPGKKKEGKDG